MVLVSVLLVYLPAVSGLAILADPVVTTVFGTQYQGVVPILQVFCAGIVLMSVTKLTEDILDYLGRANARAVFKALTSAGNVGLSVLLIWEIGAVGAAVATVAMQAIYATLCLYVVHTEIRLHPRRLLYRGAKVVGITAAMSAVVLSLLRYVDGPLTIGAVILAGVAVWGVLAKTSGLLDLGTLPNSGAAGQQSD
jgi:O-antigen/teichoic acid export membrane protein